MNLLLDSHVLIWWLERSRRLGREIETVLLKPETRPVVSAASIWEIAIKAASGRFTKVEPLDAWVPRLQSDWGIHPLPVRFEHAMAVRSLPKHHNDPFDRMLIVQAQLENLILVTVDPAIMAYDVRVLDASK